MDLLTPAAAPTAERTPRTVFVRGLLACLCVTAAIGIYALLVGSFDATGARVLGTTWLVGLYCMLCLADLTMLDTPRRAVGIAGMAAATAALALGLVLVWTVGDDWDGGLEFALRGFAVAAVVAFALAHAALLLRIDLHAADSVSAVRAATLTTLSGVAVLLTAPVVHVGLAGSEGYWRLLGTLAILDVLGTVSLPVLARLDARSAR